MLSRIRDLILLSRPGMMPLSISVPVLGAIASNSIPSATDWIGLGFIGLLAHLFGFILNDLVDYDLDRRSPLRARSLLVSGQVNRTHAWVAVFVQIPVALLCYRLVLRGTAPGVVVLGLSMLFSIVYNVWSKQGRLPRLLSEVSLALAIGLLGLSGALVKVEHISAPALLFCIAIGLVLLQVNSVPSGLKDVKTDTEAGGRSFVISIGASANHSGRLIVPAVLWRYSFVLQILIAIGSLGLLTLFQLGGLATGLSVGLVIYAGLHLRKILASDSLAEFYRSFPFLGGYYNYFAVTLFAFNYLPGIVKAIYTLALLAIAVQPIYLGLHMYQHRNQVIVKKI